MSLVLATTTIRVERVPDSATLDPGVDPLPAPMVLASGVRAHFTWTGGTETPPSEVGEQSTQTGRLGCDPVPGLDHRCEVVDETTGQRARVLWVRPVSGLGLTHIEAGVQLVEGAP